LGQRESPTKAETMNTLLTIARFFAAILNSFIARNTKEAPVAESPRPALRSITLDLTAANSPACVATPPSAQRCRIVEKVSRGLHPLDPRTTVWFKVYTAKGLQVGSFTDRNRAVAHIADRERHYGIGR